MRHFPPRKPKNANGSWSSGRDRSVQAKFRRAVIAQAGIEQCQYITLEGHHCTVTTDLQAHHLIPGNDDPSTGVLLCRYHHKLIDKHAR